MYEICAASCDFIQSRRTSLGIKACENDKCSRGVTNSQLKFSSQTSRIASLSLAALFFQPQDLYGVHDAGPSQYIGGNPADHEGMRTNGRLLVLTPLTQMDEILSVSLSIRPLN